MQSPFEIILGKIFLYENNEFSIIIYIAVLLFYFVIGKKTNRKNKFCVLAVILFALAVLMTIFVSMTGKWEYFIEQQMIFSILPAFILTAFGMTEIINICERYMSGWILGVMFVIIGLAYVNYSYSMDAFSIIKNIYKVDENVPQIDAVIRNNLEGQATVLAPIEIANDLSGFDSSLALYYGSDTLSGTVYEQYEGMQNHHDWAVYFEENPYDTAQRVYIGQQEGINVVIVNLKYQDDSAAQEYGYFCAGVTQDYIIYITSEE